MACLLDRGYKDGRLNAKANGFIIDHPSAKGLVRRPPSNACALVCMRPRMHAPSYACALECMRPRMHAPSNACALVCVRPRMRALVASDPSAHCSRVRSVSPRPLRSLARVRCCRRIRSG
jgi:hypothetical protein